MRVTVACLTLTALAACSLSARAEDWPCFRGPNASGAGAETELPTTWSDSENLAWKLELPGPGSSGPICSRDRVFVTCYSGYGVDAANPGDPKNLARHLVCLNLADGKLLWQKSVPATLPEDPYEGQLTDHGYASSTPAADGERVFVFFGKSGVLAFDWEGRQLWQKSVGTGSAIMGWGSGASLTLYKDLVIVNANAESQSLVALDKQSGRQVWKADAKGYTGSWSTPVLVAKAGGNPELVVHMPEEIWALNPATGGLLWYCSGVRGAAIPSIAAGGEVVFALGGGPMGGGTVAIRAGGHDDVTASRVLWTKTNGSYVPSPVAVDDHLYWADERGTVTCLKADTGQQVFRQRLRGAGGVYASAVAADGKLYVVTRRKGTFVLEAKPAFKVLAHNQLASDTSDFNAAPAIVHGRLLIRSNRCLYCIGAK
jgi:hypothetical protein